jgi:type IV pilus assembly protein PilC
MMVHIAADDIAGFARVLATSFQTGVPVVDSLAVLINETDGPLHDAADRIKDDVSQGIQLNHSMAQTGVFPDTVIKQVAAGEQVGSLDVVFAEIATHYESFAADK